MTDKNYVNFMDTAYYVQDCVDRLKDEGLESLSDAQQSSADRLFKMCQTYIEL